ncbi:MAG: carboxypeptidase-like regulatory domain-containing protein, partial [Christensenellales bacterium]
ALNVNLDGNNKLSLSLPEEGGIRLGLNLTDAEINNKIGSVDTTGFGGINGLFIGASGISFDLEKLVDSLLDTLDADNLEINIEKRGSYWTRRDLYSFYPYVNASGPTYYPDDFAGYDGRDAETFTTLIKVIKVGKAVYEVTTAIMNLVAAIASWGTNVKAIIDAVKKAYDAYKTIKSLIDEVKDWDDQNLPKLYRNTFSRGRVLINRTSSNVLELELGVPSVKNGAIIAYVEDSTLIVNTTLEISFELLGMKFDVQQLANSALAGLGKDYESSGFPLTFDGIYPLNANSIFTLVGLISDIEDTSDYYGRIYGRLVDNYGAPVKNATVTYTTDSAEYAVQSDKDGYYYFIEVPMTKNINPTTNPYLLKKVKKVFSDTYGTETPDDDKTVIFEGVEYVYHNGYYYVNSDRGTLSIYAPGYSSPASKTGLFIEPSQTKKAHSFEDIKMIKTTGEVFAAINVKGYAATATTSGGITAADNAEAYLAALATVDKIGGVTVKYNGGVASGTSSMLTADAANFGSFSMSFNEYADLRAQSATTMQHNFDVKLGGYEWNKTAVGRYDGTAVYLSSPAQIDNWLGAVCDGKSGEVAVELYFLLTREARDTVTIVGTLCEYVEATDFLVDNPVIGEYYEYDAATYAYTRTTDVKFVANKTYYKKSIPLPDDFTIWVAVADRGGSNWQTVGVHDYYELEPDNYSTYVDNETGTFSITTSELAKGKDYKLKIRSTKYQNIDLRLAGTDKYVTYTDGKNRSAVTTFEYSDESGDYINANFVMERREAHWSDSYTDSSASLLEGLRVRIGADVLDENYVDNHPYVDSSEKYKYEELEYQTGKETIYNDFTYIEAWLNSAQINKVLMSINNLLWGLDGTMEVNPGAALTPKDISISNLTEDGDFDPTQYAEAALADKGESYYKDRFIKLYRGQYNEDDFKVGDKIYQSEGAYKQAIISASQKTASGLIHYILMMVFIDLAGMNKLSYDFSWLMNLFGDDYDESYLGVLDIIAFAIASPESLEIIPYLGGILSQVGTFLGNVLGMLSQILTGLVPFYTGYNMFETTDLTDSPLNAAQYSYSMTDDAGIEIDSKTGSLSDMFYDGNSSKEYGKFTVDGKEVTLKQSTTEHDRSVYAKITLDDGSTEGALDNIRLVVNSASYSKDAESGGSEILEGNRGEADDKTKDWNYDYNTYTGQNGRFVTISSEQISKAVYTKATDAGTVTAGKTEYNGKALYVRVTGTDTYIAASEMGSDVSGYESEYYYLSESTKKTNVSKTYYFQDDTGATYSIKAVDIRTMMVIEKGQPVAFDGKYTDKNGNTVSGYSGVNFATNVEFMKDWIGSSNYNSYSVTDVYYEDEYTGEKVVYYSFFVFDAYGDKYDMANNGNSIKDDEYQEIDIDLNGIDIRNVINTDFSDVKFYRYVKDSDGYGAVGTDDGTGTKVWTNPTKIILYDVYDLTDFRAIGGSWALEGTSGGGAGRRNYDPNVTLESILANRANVKFGDGLSTGSNGVSIVWNFDALKSTKQVEGQKIYLQGYIGNAVFAEIEVEIVTTDLNDADGAESEANRVKTQLLQAAQDITFDPYVETVEDFINKFYDVFMAEYSSTDVDAGSNPLREKTYIYNDLVWSLEYTLSSLKDAEGNRIKVYDSLVDYDNATITLKYRTYGKNADGEAFKSNTAWNTITLNLNKVKNYTIDTVTSRIEGEGVLDGGIVTADKALIKERIKRMNPSLKDAEVEKRAAEYAGMVDINPLNNSDPYSTLAKVESFDVTLLTLKSDGSKEIVSGWEIIPGTFTALANRDGRSLADYDSLDTSEQNYTVTYNVTDATGNIQTVKVWVHIQASAITGTSDGLENEVNMSVIPYQDPGLGAAATDIEQVLAKLNLKASTGIVYENTEEAEGRTGEIVSLGENAKMRYIALVVPATDVSGMTAEEAAEAYEVKGFIYIQGENGLSYAIPVKKYDDESKVECTYKTSAGVVKTGEASFVIDLEVGKQGYARTEMNEIITNVLLDSAKSNTTYTLNKAKGAAYDALYAISDRYTRNKLAAAYAENKNKYPLLGDAGVKANVWDDLYESYTDKNAKTYSPADALTLDVMLLTEQLKYSSLTYTGAKSRGYDSIAAAGIISARKLADILEEKSAANASATTTQKKALAWDEWYEDYTRAVIGLARNVETRTVGK